MLKMKYLFITILIASLYSCQTEAQEEHKSSKTSEFEITKSDAEWRKELTTAEYQVLRKSGTEMSNSSPLNNIHEPGTFVCTACKNPVYKTLNKFESGSGWPSFDQPIQGNIKLVKDNTLNYQEVICAKCGSHLGHVFNDGPRNTTGKRHCINGVALNFISDKKN